MGTGDIDRFQLWYNTSNSLTGATELNAINTPSPGTLTFSGFSQSIPVGTAYLMVTCDIANTATVGNTVGAAFDADADFTYSSATFSGSSFGAATDNPITGSPVIQLQYPVGTDVNCGAGTVAFGTVYTGNTSDQTFRIVNSGTGTLTLTTPLTISGTNSDQYTIVTQPSSTIAAGAHADVVVRFAPTSVGVKNASITIISDASNHSSCAINLQGTGAIQEKYFRSIATGDWSNLSTWETSLDLLSWTAATHTPTGNDLAVYIRAPHTVTISSSAEVTQTDVQPGATLDVTGGTVTVNNGAAAYDIYVRGILKNSTNSAFTLAGGAAIVVQDGGRYQHNAPTAGSITPMTWDAGSTCEIIAASGKPGGLNQSYYNFIWNSSTHGAGTINLTGDLKTVNGDLQVLETGTGKLRFTGSSPGTLTIGGDFIIANGREVDFGNGSAACTVDVGGDLIINDGATLSLMGGSSANGTLILRGDLNASTSSTITENTSGTNCRLIFQGSSPQYASFSNMPERVNIEINNSNNVSIQSDLTLRSNSNLIFTNGKLILGDFTLDMTDAGSITGADQNKYVVTNGATSSLRRNVGTTEVEFPIGQSTLSYNPVSITTTSGNADFFARVFDGVYDDGVGLGNVYTSDVVDKTWDIYPLTGNPTVTIKVAWTSSNELTGFDNAHCNVAHYTNSGWEEDTDGAATGGFILTRERSGVSTFSPFAVVRSGFLPVELSKFEAISYDHRVALYWETQSEKNSDYFAIERSEDGKNFEKIGTTAAAGASSFVRNYKFMDEQPLSGVSYYRLRQVDLDGNYTFSDVRSVKMETRGDLVLSPTIADNTLEVDFGLTLTNDADLKIIDMGTGRVVKSLIKAAGTSSTTINVGDLPAGSYIFSMKNEGSIVNKRFVIVR